MYGTFARDARMSIHRSWHEAADALLAIGYATYHLGTIFVTLPGVTIRRIR